MEGLPFALTDHQSVALAEIDADLRRAAPMRRLLQGDVGSGKTVVALHACCAPSNPGCRAALMAPTETLAGAARSRRRRALGPAVSPRSSC